MSAFYLPAIDCEVCGAPADFVHFLPYVIDCEHVAFTCPDCDLGGYGFEFARLPSMAPHISETKLGGYHALGLLFERLAVFAQRTDGRS